MSSRKSRLNLSFRQSECSTPINKRNRISAYSDSSPMNNDVENSPAIPMSQDTSNLISGVTWAWSSPKRLIGNDNKKINKPSLQNLNSTQELQHRRPRKKNSEKLAGFHKFHLELKLLQESEPPNEVYTENEGISTLCPVVAEKNSPEKICKPDSNIQSDSFNDSDLDNLLLQASQFAENCNPVASCSVDAKQPKASATMTSKTDDNGDNEKPLSRTIYKSKTTDNFDCIRDVMLDDSDLDSILVKASQIFEEACNGITEKIEDKKENNSLNAKKTAVLMRHKSMPESPSPKIVHSRNYQQSSKSELCDDPVAKTTHFTNVATPLPASHTVERQCTKEEIEHKRQEALKRQRANRLKRSIQGLHSLVDPRI